MTAHKNKTWVTSGGVGEIGDGERVFEAAEHDEATEAAHDKDVEQEERVDVELDGPDVEARRHQMLQRLPAFAPTTSCAISLGPALLAKQ